MPTAVALYCRQETAHLFPLLRSRFNIWSSRNTCNYQESREQRFGIRARPTALPSMSHVYRLAGLCFRLWPELFSIFQLHFWSCQQLHSSLALAQLFTSGSVRSYLINMGNLQTNRIAGKPLNVETPTILYIRQTIAEILVDAGSRAISPFKDTPLDFVEGQLYTSSQMPLSHLWGVQQRPLPRIPNDRDSRLYDLKTVIIVAIPTATFSLLHLIAWNFHFPTHAELLLWRWTCVSMGLVLATGCLVEAISIVRDRFTTSGLTTLNCYKLKWPTNLLFFIPGFLYFTARLIVIIEIAISLRRLPDGCFRNVDWIQVLPHF